MPKPRKLLVDLDTTHTYHCVARCVRRAFLLGDDPVSGRNFDHRKQWVADRIEQLSGVFAAGVCSYGLMSNHLHLVLRVEPEIAKAWAPEDIALRYGSLFRKTVEQASKQPPDVLARRIEVWRERLYSLSWFMRCLCENIARRANAEDDCTGRYWEGRFNSPLKNGRRSEGEGFRGGLRRRTENKLLCFVEDSATKIRRERPARSRRAVFQRAVKSQALLDDAALVTCMAYVDLNPIRAGIAGTLEESDFTSIQARLLDAARPRQAESKALWLVPFADDGAAVVAAPTSGGIDKEQAAVKSAVEPLPLTLDEYRELLRATIERVRPVEAGDDGGAAAASLTPRSDAARMTLSRLGLNPRLFVDAMRHLSERFFTMIGRIDRMGAEGERRKYKRVPGLKAAGRLYDASD